MYPFEIKPVEKSKNDELTARFVGEDQFYQVGPKKFIINSSYLEQAEGFYNMEIKNDDVWLLTYPRSGTTWTQEMLWLLTHNLDFAKSESTLHKDKFLWIDKSIQVGNAMKEIITERLRKDSPDDVEKLARFLKKIGEPGYETIKPLESPRCIKTHLPLSFLPPNLLDKAKVVYVARNPKDCAVSNFYHNKGGPNGFEGEFDDYWPLFKEGLLLCGPHIEHVRECWERRDHPNLLFLFYEDLKKDLPNMIKKLANFLGKSLMENEVAALVNHLRFENMKDIEAKLRTPKKRIDKSTKIDPHYPHFRHGKVGYSDEYRNIGNEASEWLEKQIKTTGIPFRTTE